jgi:hypothetical protein
MTLIPAIEQPCDDEHSPWFRVRMCCDLCHLCGSRAQFINLPGQPVIECSKSSCWNQVQGTDLNQVMIDWNKKQRENKR